MKALLLLPGLAAVCACGASTGGALVTFHAAAAGPADAVAGQPLVFSTPAIGAKPTYDVTLTRAVLHIGAVYLNQAAPISGAQAQSCILPGIYVGQVTSSLDVDTLSPTPQPFPSDGEGTSVQARTGELWLTGGDVNADTDPTVIADVAGTATQGGTSYPFAGQMTISKGNRGVPVQDPRFPSLKPICKERIISGIPIDLTLAQGGTLLVRVDPREWFRLIDFAQLPAVSGATGARQFVDATTGIATDLLPNVEQKLGVYSFNWQSP
jgi:hypothetical protein